MADMAEEFQPFLCKIEDLRESFRTKYKENLESDVYDQRDVTRLMEDDRYAVCFMRSFSNEELSLESPTEMVDKVFKFRKEYGVQDLTEASFPDELKARNFLYWKGKNVDGQKILHFRVALHKKGTLFEEVKRYILYFLESHHREHTGERIVLVFDFTGAGITNMDLEVVKFIISALSNYFPSLLAYILLFEMPWLLSSVWKLIQTWLSKEQREKIILVKRADLPKYIGATELETMFK